MFTARYVLHSTFCPHSVFMCFVWIWEQTVIISLYSINWLVFITETECVYCAVRSIFYVLPTQLYLCVLCASENKQRLFHCTALTGWFYNRDGVCLLRGTSRVLKCNSCYISSLNYCVIFCVYVCVPTSLLAWMTLPLNTVTKSHPNPAFVTFTQRKSQLTKQSDTSATFLRPHGSSTPTALVARLADVQKCNRGGRTLAGRSVDAAAEELWEDVFMRVHQLRAAGSFLQNY